MAPPLLAYQIPIQTLLAIAIIVLLYQWSLLMLGLGLFMIHQAVLVLMAHKRAAHSHSPPIDRLSPRLRNLLTKRSLFDVLCDIWFMPKLGTYIKLLIGPVLLGTTEEQYKQLLKKADNPALTSRFHRKGLVYMLPQSAQHVLLPYDHTPSPTLYNLQQETQLKGQQQQISQQIKQIKSLNQQARVEYSWDNFLVALSSVVMVLLYSLKGKISARLRADVQQKRLYSLLLSKLTKVPHLTTIAILVTNFMAIRHANRMIRP